MQPTQTIAVTNPVNPVNQEPVTQAQSNTSPITTKAIDTLAQPIVSPTENVNKDLILKKIEKFESLAKTSKTVAWVGLAIFITGVASAIIFFTAPVSVPLLVGAAVACLLFAAVGFADQQEKSRPGHRGGENPNMLGLILIAPAAGLGAALAIGDATFSIIKEGVYTTAAMTIGGIATGVLAGIGAVLGIAGVISRNNYKAEIVKLKDQLKQIANENEKQGDLDKAREIYEYLQDQKNVSRIEDQIRKDVDACFETGQLAKAARYYQIIDQIDNIQKVAEVYRKLNITDGRKYLFALKAEDYQQGLTKINEARRQLADEHLDKGEFELAEAWYMRFNDQEGVKKVKAKARQVEIQRLKIAAEKEIAENAALKNADVETVKRIAKTYWGEHRLWQAYTLFHSINDLESKIKVITCFIQFQRIDEAEELLISLKDPIGLFVLQHAINYNSYNLKEKIKANGLEIGPDTNVSMGPMTVKATEAIAYIKDLFKSPLYLNWNL